MSIDFYDPDLYRVAHLISRLSRLRARFPDGGLALRLEAGRSELQRARAFYQSAGNRGDGDRIGASRARLRMTCDKWEGFYAGVKA